MQFMQLSKLSIARRMTVAFFLVLASIVGIAVYSLSKLAAIHSNLEEIVTQNNVQIRIGNEMSESIHVISLGTRNMVLIQGRLRKVPEKETLEKAEQAYAAARGELEKFAMADDEKSLLADIDSNFAIAIGIFRKVIPMLVNDDEEAPLVVLNQLNPAMQKVQTAIHALSTYKKDSTEIRWEEAQAHYDASRVAMILFSVLTVVVAVLAGWRVTLSITRQLGGEPSDATHLAKRVSQGDLTVEVALRSGNAESLMAQLGAMQSGLIEVVSGVRHGAEGVASASSEIASGNNDLSARTESQGRALEATAASMAQLSSTVRRNADNARQANQLALRASSVAVKGGSAVTQVVATMRDINDSSRKINDIISVIDGIAFQTNILALNAAVEAARAGEQGRGFAVVASEVRALAGRSASAAKEIKLLINASVDRVQQGTVLVDAAGITMSEVVDAIKRVTDIVAEISAASDEQALGVAHVGEAVTDMDRVTQRNAALVERMAAAAINLKEQAQELVKTVAVFQLTPAPEANFSRLRDVQSQAVGGEDMQSIRPLALT